MMHSPYTLLTPDQYIRMPWKNGLGVTLEIARIEDANGVLFRLSQAAVVEDGAFSDFSGMHRTLVLINGHGMQLTHTSLSGEISRHHLSHSLDIARFSGADKTEAHLTHGEIQDLNIMVREEEVISYVQALNSGLSLDFSENDQTLFDGFYATKESKLLITPLNTTTEPIPLKVTATSTVRITTPVTLSLQEGQGVAIQCCYSTCNN
ncbi:HutD/Ves family protein [Vibrio tritonius]|uniref:HutD/Ves family protein n=1 Tax=Vibrio tritonius TaxID=1435069 RepID=UPI00315D3200